MFSDYLKIYIQKIFEQLDICDMTKDEVWMRLESMCDAGLLDKQEQKNGETFFKERTHFLVKCIFLKLIHGYVNLDIQQGDFGNNIRD